MFADICIEEGRQEPSRPPTFLPLLSMLYFGLVFLKTALYLIAIVQQRH